jgi:DNA-binding MarR family transcriptional regulator
MAARTPRKARTRDAPHTVTRGELLVDDSDATFRHFVHGLLAFSERVMAVRQGFGQIVGLSGVQYTVLVSIAHLQDHGAVSVGAVAAHLHLSGAFVTTVTKELERRGLIRKARAKTDRRRVALATTRNGRDLLEQLAPIQQKVNDELFAPLGRTQFTELAAHMDALVLAADRALVLLDYLCFASASESAVEP